MLSAQEVQKKRKQELTDQRKALCEEFEHHPTEIHLALELKIIDDQIAECHQQIRDSGSAARLALPNKK